MRGDGELRLQGVKVGPGIPNPAHHAGTAAAHHARAATAHHAGTRPGRRLSNGNRHTTSQSGKCGREQEASSDAARHCYFPRIRQEQNRKTLAHPWVVRVDLRQGPVNLSVFLYPAPKPIDR
jgi:hypothetical protein